jgi:hypothetical protein
MVGANSQDYACVGDPDNECNVSWRRVELAKRRVYRGMLYKYTTDGTGAHQEVKDADGKTIYYTNGIRDAATLPDPNWATRNYGHDFVISNGNSPTSEDCEEALSRTDADPDGTSDTVNLFHNVSGDFICLNADYDNSGPGDWAVFEGYPWIYLNSFDTDVYDVPTDCPYDPSDPPSKRYTIAGTITFDTAPEMTETWGSTDPTLDTDDGTINTTDGFDNCTVTGISGTSMSYTCDYYVWEDLNGEETPWVGAVVLTTPVRTMCAPGNSATYDPAALAWQTAYTFDAGITGTQTADFTCKDLTKFTIAGEISVDAGNDLSTAVFAIEADNQTANGCQIQDGTTTRQFSCEVLEQTYVSGYTGSVRITLPEGFKCEAGSPTSSTLGVTTSCSTDTPSVAAWNFTALEAASVGNNLLLDGPKEQIMFTGTVKNNVASAGDMFTDMKVTTSDGVICTTALAVNNKDVDYTCSAIVLDGESWNGTVTIDGPSAYWCGDGAADGTVTATNINDGDTLPNASCVAATEEPVIFQVVVKDGVTPTVSGDWYDTSIVTVTGTQEPVPCSWLWYNYPSTLATVHVCTTPSVPVGETWSGSITLVPTVGYKFCPSDTVTFEGLIPTQTYTEAVTVVPEASTCP